MTWVSAAMLAWAAAVVAAAWSAPRGWQLAAVASLSAAFLVLHAPLSAALLAGFGSATYFLLRGERPSGVRTAGVVAAIVAVLVASKWGVDTNAAAAVDDVLVPLGLSYYSLRAIHYAVERYKGTLPAHGFGQYLGYLFFFPMLVAGPISRFPEFLRDLRRRRWDGALFSRGLERILHGFAKIVVLGNYLLSIEAAAWIADTLPPGSAAAAYLDCLRYGLNLYVQFSGFSDVAIGLGMLAGFRLMENFRAPFLAPNIAEFWRRWHISLTSWCRTYFYLPAAAATRRPLAGVLLTMIAIGLWHELSLRFLVWGVVHGAAIALATLFGRWKRAAPPSLARVGHAASVALTFNFVILSFALTKEPDLGAALGVYRALLGLG